MCHSSLLLIQEKLELGNCLGEVETLSENPWKMCQYMTFSLGILAL